MKTILSFDIGIRNLAWCAMRTTDVSGAPIQILGWENYDLLEGQAASKPIKGTCSGCSASASYESETALYCVRHCPLRTPALRDLSGTLLKKLPAAKGIQELLSAKGVAYPPKSKALLVKKIREFYCLPIVKVKVKKAIDTELAILHEAIRKFILQRKELFGSVNEILLENQPALKNPTMKSVQILLFATLRDLLQPEPPKLRLVHAKMKVKGKETGDAGYKDRKEGGEIRVKKWLESSRIETASKWRTYLASNAKKNDLTDAFCMCLDGFSLE